MSAVLQERRGTSYWITLNRPQRRNSLNGEVIAGLTDGLRAAQADGEARAIVLTGCGEQAFCAGADLQPDQSFTFDYSVPTNDYAQLLRLALDCRLPIIARVNGACMAGGMGLLCVADLAVASESAVFGLPEVKVGVFPFQVLALLQRLVPARVVREWCLCGEPIDAATALRWGLVNHLAPGGQLDRATERLLGRILGNSPSAVRRGRYALRAMQDMSAGEALAFAEGQIALMALTEDAREGLASFIEKREPKWTGR